MPDHDAHAPCSDPPGTEGRIHVYAARAELGLPLFHDGDSCATVAPVELSDRFRLPDSQRGLVRSVGPEPFQTTTSCKTS